MKAMVTRKTVDELLRDRLRELGAIGGRTAAGKLSKAERAAKAGKAATTRWTQKQDEPLKVHSDPLEPRKKAPAKKKGK